MMRTNLLALGVVFAALALPGGVAEAKVAPPPPVPVRIVQSDAVFVGKVTGIEPVDVEVKAYPGSTDTIKYRIAVVQIEKAIRGLKDEKSVRVGFIPQEGKVKLGRPPVKVEIGQEGLFMINKHSVGKFYQAPGYGYFTAKKAPNFDAEVKAGEKAMAILADIKAALKSKNADERLMAASLAVTQYRTQQPPFPNKEVPIDAEESKLILNAISTAKWGEYTFNEIHPQQVFSQLGINEKDGFRPPTNFNDPDSMRDAVQGWIRDHGDYRVKRFVPGKEK